MLEPTICLLKCTTLGVVLAAVAARFASAWVFPSLPFQRQSVVKGGLIFQKTPWEALLSAVDDNDNDSSITQIQNDEGADEPDEPPSLSDDELLLACRAYLQRKNKLGKWIKFEKRKAAKERQRDVSRESLTGFFWEDPTELKYYRQNINSSATSLASRHLRDEELMNSIYDTEEETYDDYDDDETSARITSTTQTEQVSFEFPGRDENDNLAQMAREFSTFPTRPSKTRIRRSESAKKRWQDLELKAKWYEQRWGSQTKKPRKKPGYKERLEALTLDFLSSQVFLNLTEAEIHEAVEIYANANQKRAISRKTTLKERRAALEPTRSETPIPLDALSWDRDPKALEEARHQRSERSRKAYQTRLINSNNTAANGTAPKRAAPRRVPKGVTPQDALIRVEADLDQGNLPSLGDLEIICGPRKLPKRKGLLKRLLLDHFKLRGKCVPIAGNSDNLQFVTSCPIDDLSEFVLTTVRQKDQKKKDKKSRVDPST